MKYLKNENIQLGIGLLYNRRNNGVTLDTMIHRQLINFSLIWRPVGSIVKNSFETRLGGPGCIGPSANRCTYPVSRLFSRSRTTNMESRTLGKKGQNIERGH